MPGDDGFPCRDVDPPGPGPGDHTCWPVEPDLLWLDGTDDDGFCWPEGNSPGGAGALGSACDADADCASPLGLGSCFALWGAPLSFCAVACNRRLAESGFCVEPGDGGVPAGVCWSGLCVATCDPSRPAGSNGCPQDGLACYPVESFDPNVSWDRSGTPPSGTCLPACTSDAFCEMLWGGSRTCDAETGRCVSGSP
jgi:hypothetical protein